jgi:hypothetical protein
MTATLTALLAAQRVRDEALAVLNRTRPTDPNWHDANEALERAADHLAEAAATHRWQNDRARGVRW